MQMKALRTRLVVSYNLVPYMTCVTRSTRYLYLFMNLGFFSISETSGKATFVFVGTQCFTKNIYVYIYIYHIWYQIVADDVTSP